MFRKLAPAWVKSDKGFEVRGKERFISEYIEGKRKLSVCHEPGIVGNKHYQLLYNDSLSHWDDGTPINKEKQKEIFENYKEAMEFQNIGVSF